MINKGLGALQSSFAFLNHTSQRFPVPEGHKLLIINTETVGMLCIALQFCFTVLAQVNKKTFTGYK